MHLGYPALSLSLSLSRRKTHSSMGFIFPPTIHTTYPDRTSHVLLANNDHRRWKRGFRVLVIFAIDGSLFEGERCKIDDQARVIANGDTILGSVPGIYSFYVVQREENSSFSFSLFSFSKENDYYIKLMNLFIYLERKLFKVYENFIWEIIWNLILFLEWLIEYRWKKWKIYFLKLNRIFQSSYIVFKYWII